MLTEIEDLKQLPKLIIVNNKTYFLSIDTSSEFFIIEYTNRFGGVVARVEVLGCIKLDIEENYNGFSAYGEASTLTEAVNMLYEYISNNKDIEVYA